MPLSRDIFKSTGSTPGKQKLTHAEFQQTADEWKSFYGNSEKIKTTEIVSAVGSIAAALFTLAAIVTAAMLTRQTRIMGRSLQVQEDNLKLLERQTLSAEKRDSQPTGMAKPETAV